VLAAVEERYQRSQIKTRRIGTSNKFTMALVRSSDSIAIATARRHTGSETGAHPAKKQQLQVDRLAKFKKKNAEKANARWTNSPTSLNAVRIASRCCSKRRKSVR
jgi:hypothetical protein